MGNRYRCPLKHLLEVHEMMFEVESPAIAVVPPTCEGDVLAALLCAYQTGLGRGLSTATEILAFSDH